MEEEQHYEQSTAPSLCANNCGFFGNATTLNLCSKCYRDHVLTENQSQKMDALLHSTTSVKSMPPPSPSLSLPRAVASIESVSAESPSSSSSAVSETTPSGPSRCGSCRKRVGLIGFKCKCGMTFCGTHRYPEQHSCSIDFQKLGKEAIAKANPVIKAAKLDKI